MVELDPKVTIPVKVACPFGSIVTPLPTLIPLRAVINPIASTFLTSSYTNVPPIVTLVNSPVTAVIIPAEISLDPAPATICPVIFDAVKTPTVILSEGVNVTLPVLP